MIKVEHLSYSYPQKDLYTDLSFTLEDGQHCAFIGTSGSGKSTLIDLLMSKDDYHYDGKIRMDSNCRIGYVSQFPKWNGLQDCSVFDYIANDFTLLQHKISALCEKMGTSEDLDSIMEEYQIAFDQFQAIDGDNYENNILKKLNLADLGERRNLSVSKLSGGEFKLVCIMKEMSTNPNLLIMDEPDVFLDFDNLNSLRQLINSYNGTLLVITHNRYLLNHCFNKILHLENMELQEFDGRYIDYNFALLEKKIELMELAAADTEEIERTEQVIDRLRAIATHNAHAAMGKTLNARVKILERLEARRIKTPFVDIKQPEIKFQTLEKSKEDSETSSISSPTIQVSDYQVAFDDILLENVNFEIGANDKVALIGTNGSGKTTLLREIFHNKTASITINGEPAPAYLSQVQGEVLKEENLVLHEFLDLGFDTNHSVHLHLSDFGLEQEILHQPISSLSGGEKNILQLAKICAKQSNLLLLDEPTSHLDTYSQIALEQAIRSYDGAVLMISHDFYTIVNSMDYVLLIEDKGIRKMSMRAFRKKIYAHHFNKDYLELEQKKKEQETKIELALKDHNFEQAKTLCNVLKTINNRL